MIFFSGHVSSEASRIDESGSKYEQKKVRVSFNFFKRLKFKKKVRIFSHIGSEFDKLSWNVTINKQPNPRSNTPVKAWQLL